jgi:hypothetical protein
MNNYVVESFNYKSQCGQNRLPKVIQHIINEKKWKHSIDNWNYYFPCEYTKCENNIKELKLVNKDSKIFMIDGCDTINSKLLLWKALKKKYKRVNAQKIMPNTFLLKNTNDIQKFKTHYASKMKQNKNTIFVMKNYKQRQLGIKLSRNLDEIVNGHANGFFLVQDYVNNPFIMKTDGRKINFRYYLLIVCRHGKIESYIYNNGFAYYTPKPFNAKSIDFNAHITTGYIDRKVYDTNPLTLTDWNKYVDTNCKITSSEWTNRVCILMTKVMNALQPNICKNSKYKSTTLFQLFGADIAPTNDLTPYLMEINKGPDIGPKDDRDRKVKINLIRDTIDVVENTRNKNYRKIY